MAATGDVSPWKTDPAAGAGPAAASSARFATASRGGRLLRGEANPEAKTLPVLAYVLLRSSGSRRRRAARRVWHR
jgi:hypothetical protein